MEIFYITGGCKNHHLYLSDAKWKVGKMEKGREHRCGVVQRLFDDQVRIVKRFT